ncbi:hypothetical protein [Levilactobacillus wangkuiensis]|uniref:hypothetical protein n=1 Tax=Levilactobacillus wangkuiensis TaxID=2799566 RepID=UPI001941A94F|nr:hypothetical protein [Levilactobacillus wangkuiensis]
MKKVFATAAAVVFGLTLGAVAQPQTSAQAAKYHQGMPKVLRGKWMIPKKDHWQIVGENEDNLKYFKVSNKKFVIKQIDTNDTYLSPRYKKTSKGHYTVLTHYKMISTIVKGRVFKSKKNVKMHFVLKKGVLNIKGNSSIVGLPYQRVK